MHIATSKVIVPAAASITRAMRCIDSSGLRVVYLTDDDGRLAGAVSDSEIRKAILHGIDMHASTAGIMNRNPVVLTEAEVENRYTAQRQVRRLLNRMPDSQYILIIDRHRRPRRMLRCSKFVPRAVPDAAAPSGGRNVLVVGGAGYLGSVLVRHLLRHGYQVRVLDRLLFGPRPLAELRRRRGFDLQRGDIRDLNTVMEALRGMDAVVNLAALVGDPACANRPQTAITTNYLANKLLAEACRYHQINRFVFASTCSVYGAMNGTQKLTEEAPLHPVSLYARSKIQAEEGILALRDGNFSPTILRMGTLYGPSPRMRFDLVVNTMVKHAVAAGTITVQGGGGQWRPLLHVADAAEAYRLCLAAPLHKVSGAVFNVGCESQNYRVREIAAAVGAASPTARVVTTEATADSRNYAVSFARIRRRLGFHPRRTLLPTARTLVGLVRSGIYGNLELKKYYNVKLEGQDDGEE